MGLGTRKPRLHGRVPHSPALQSPAVRPPLASTGIRQPPSLCWGPVLHPIWAVSPGLPSTVPGAGPECAKEKLWRWQLILWWNHFAVYKGMKSALYT